MAGKRARSQPLYKIRTILQKGQQRVPDYTTLNFLILRRVTIITNIVTKAHEHNELVQFHGLQVHSLLSEYMIGNTRMELHGRVTLWMQVESRSLESLSLAAWSRSTSRRLVLICLPESLRPGFLLRVLLRNLPNSVTNELSVTHLLTDCHTLNYR